VSDEKKKSDGLSVSLSVPGQTVFSLNYQFEDGWTGKEEDKARSTGRRVTQEDGTEALEFIEDDDPQEIKVAKRLMGATKRPKLRVYKNGKEMEIGYDYEEKK